MYKPGRFSKEALRSSSAQSACLPVLTAASASLYGERMTRPVAPIGARARIPNPALQPFAVLVGTWRTEGSHPLLPQVTLHGQASFEWIENGAFLLMRSEIDDARVPHGIAIF